MRILAAVLIVMLASCAAGPPPASQPASLLVLEPPFTLMGNAAARLVTAVNSDPRYAIEVYEIAVGREPAELHMDGAAILEVRYGDGMVDVDGRTTKVSPGSVVSVAEGAALRVTNTTPLPMTLRANVIRAKR